MLGRGKRPCSALLMQRSLDAALRRMLQFVPGVQDAYTGHLTAHYVHVGTTSAFTKLGLSEPQLKSWIGRAPASAVWSEYARNLSYMVAEVAFSCLLFS